VTGKLNAAIAVVLTALSVGACGTYPLTELENQFTMPSGSVGLNPGQSLSMPVPDGKLVLITDIYIENLGGGRSVMQISEQVGENLFRIRYTFGTPSEETTALSFTTGLKLGEEEPIRGSIRVTNLQGTGAAIAPRLNGIFVDQD